VRERPRVDVRVMHADATALREAGVGSDFRLVLDTGTFGRRLPNAHRYLLTCRIYA
jgi:hypothetical protein